MAISCINRRLFRRPSAWYLLSSALVLCWLATMIFRQPSPQEMSQLVERLDSESVESASYYAIVTVVLTKDYEDTAMALCVSVRSHFDDEALPDHLDLVAYVPEDAHERRIDIKWLECCFSQIQTLPSVTVSRPPSFGQFQELYIKLNLWHQTQYKRLLYLDADFVVIRLQPLLDLLCHSRIAFGAVQDWNGGTWAEHWNGGLLLLEPHVDTYQGLISNLELFIREGRFNTDWGEQGYLSAYFDHRGFTLPSMYNLNMAMKFQAPEMWERYVGEAVAIHFTWAKPWLTSDNNASMPWSLWWMYRLKADARCPRQ